MPPFRSLDFLYVPSQDPRAEAAYYADVLGAELLFHVKGMGTVVAGLRLSDDGPLVLLAEHLEGASPILVYRVDDLEETKRTLTAQGWTADEEFEIPHGPICVFVAAGGQRLAIYELTRPGANDHFIGRFDD